MAFPRQEYRSKLPFPTPGDLPSPGTNPHLLHFLHWQVDSYTGKIKLLHKKNKMQGWIRSWGPASDARIPNPRQLWDTSSLKRMTMFAVICDTAWDHWQRLRWAGLWLICTQPLQVGDWRKFLQEPAAHHWGHSTEGNSPNAIWSHNSQSHPFRPWVRECHSP